MISGLAVKLMDEITLPYAKDFADAWRIYQKTELYNEVCKYCLDIIGNNNIEVVFAVSELGMPLAISIGYDYYNLGKNNIDVALLNTDIENDEDWILPYCEVKKRNVLLCDDLMAGGGHMYKALCRLKALETRTISAIVILDNRNELKRDGAEEIYRELGDNFIALTDSTLAKVE